MDDMEKLVSFLEEAEKLKSVVRTAWTGTGRRESTAEHTWRLALLAGLMADSFPVLDMPRVLLMCLLHDIGEIYEGDVSAASSPDKADKYQTEYRAAQAVFSLLPQALSARMMAIWQEYQDNATPEARLVKALDKAETIIQHNQGENPADFNYRFNLEYGKGYFEGDSALERLRAIIDEKTRQRIVQASGASPFSTEDK